MQITVLKYGYSRAVDSGFDATLDRMKRILREQGFGVQAEINISDALKEKLGVEVPRHTILGVCNPQLAYKALQAEPDISLLLPCNVTVREAGSQVEVSVIDAGKMMQFVNNPDLKPVADEANRRLQTALAGI